MGLVICSLICAIICLTIFVKSFKYIDGCKLFGKIVGWSISVIFGTIGGLSALCFLVYVCVYTSNYIKKDLHLQEYKNKRYSIVRMLQEDYNSQNLSNAIDFNNKQKMIVVENKSFLFKYTTSYYSVDTIQIPEKKFMPTSKVIVEGLEMDTE